MATKRTLPAKEILADIRAGITDEELLRNYGLSAKGLQGIFDKLVKAGLLNQAELDQRFAPLEQSVDLHAGDITSEMTLALWKCPACHMPQFHECEECPQCGVIVRKFLEKQAKSKEQTNEVKAEEAVPVSTKPPHQRNSLDAGPSSVEPALQTGTCFQVAVDVGLHLLHNAKRRLLNSVQSPVHKHNTETDAPVGPSSPHTTRKVADTPTPSPVDPFNTSPLGNGSRTPPENSSLGIWKCPFCHMPQPHEFEECPQCGIIVAKFQDKLRASESPDSSRPREEETSNNPPLSLDRTGPSSSLFDDKRLHGLIAAGFLLCLILWAFLPSQNEGISRIQSTEQQPKPSNRAAYTQEQRQTIQDIKDARAREDRLRQRLIQKPGNQVMSFPDPVEATRRAFEEENRRIDMENRARATARDAVYDELWNQFPNKRGDLVNSCMSRCFRERPADTNGCLDRCDRN